MTDIYIFSKPLQFFVCDMIHDPDEPAYFIVTDMFSAARDFYAKLKNERINLDVLFAKNRFISIIKAAFLKGNNLHIDGDIGTRMLVYLLIYKILNPRSLLFVYEEGIGTYRKDIYKNSFKKKIFKILGIGTYFGGSCLCDGVYVFNAPLYESVFRTKKDFQIKSISKTIYEYCEANLDNLCILFNLETLELPMNEEVVLYLSSWEIYSSALSMIERNYQSAKKMIKLHPHIRNQGKTDGFISVHAGVPAELLLLQLLKRNCTVEVYHHGSSVERYIQSGKVRYTLIK